MRIVAFIVMAYGVLVGIHHIVLATTSSTSSGTSAPLSAAAQQAKQAGTAEGQTLAQETPFTWPGKQTAEYGNITQYFLSLVSQDGNTRYGKAGLIGAEASACGATLDGQYGGPNYSKSDIFNNDSPRNEYLNSCSNYLEANLVIGYNGQGSPLTFIGTPTGSTGNTGTTSNSGGSCLQCTNGSSGNSGNTGTTPPLTGTTGACVYTSTGVLQGTPSSTGGCPDPEGDNPQYVPTNAGEPGEFSCDWTGGPGNWTPDAYSASQCVGLPVDGGQ